MVNTIQMSIILTAAVCGSDEDIPIKLHRKFRVQRAWRIFTTHKVVRDRRMVRLTSTTISTRLSENVITT